MCAPSGVAPSGGMPPESSSVEPVVSGAPASPSPSTSGFPVVESLSGAASTVGSVSTSSSKSMGSIPSSFDLAAGSSLVFSPSRTEKWLTCPMLEDYERRWVPLSRKEAPWTPHLAIGNAIHAGLAAWHSLLEGGKVTYLEEAFLVLEREFEEGGPWTLEGLKKLVAKGIRASLDSPLMGPDDQVVAVEDTIGECRADLIFRTPGVGLHVFDYKTKLEAKTEWIARDLAPFEESWQLQHTAWAVQEKYGEPVVEAGVQLIVLSPRCKAYPASMKLDAERLANWLRSAERVWALMGMKKPWMNTQSCRKFGGCQYLKACHIMAGDESKFPAFYERIG